MLAIVSAAASLANTRELHAALLRHTVKVERASRAFLVLPWERRTIERHAAAVCRALRPDVLDEADKVPVGGAA